MIELNKMMLVNYCHPETTAFYRFGDFENYYKLREAQDKYLYDEFVSIGGKPETDHLLSFVIEGSDYLKEWFGKGIETRIPIAGIDEKHISFTLGDGGAKYGRNGSVELLGLKDMTELLSEQTGDFDDFLNAIGKQYVEVQLWSDEYIR